MHLPRQTILNGWNRRSKTIMNQSWVEFRKECYGPKTSQIRQSKFGYPSDNCSFFNSRFITVHFSLYNHKTCTNVLQFWFPPNRIRYSNRKKRGIVKKRLWNSKLNSSPEEKKFWIQECYWPPHWVISPTVSTRRLGGSRGPQPDSLSAPTRSSPMAQVFILFNPFYRLANLTHLSDNTCLRKQCST